MALIENAKGRRDNQPPSGYTRLFGVVALGNLMSRVQGALISAGTELEKLIWARVNQIDDLDRFLSESLEGTGEGFFVANKKQVKKSKTINSKYEPDFLGFDLTKRLCYIVEVKDGDQFDTKKASGEHTTLHNFTNDVSSALPFSTRIYLCSFNVNTRDEVWLGLKKKFSKDEVLTGRELCILFKIDYNEIVELRAGDQQSNLHYFVREIFRIGEIKNIIVGLLKQLKERGDQKPK